MNPKLCVTEIDLIWWVHFLTALMIYYRYHKTVDE